MSWLDRIRYQQLEITMGDGSVFTPIWRISSKTREYNAARFDFTEIEGTLVKRGKVSSPVYPVELIFQGENHIDESERFDEASKDQRPWTVRHPYYDEILVHPSSVRFNHNSQNVTIITVDLFETIPDTFPDTSVDLKESALQEIEALTGEISTNYDENLGAIQGNSLSTVNSTTGTIANAYRDFANTQEDLEELESAVAQLNSATSQITADANQFMNRAAQLARTPARFYDTINRRISTIKASYDNLRLAIVGTVNRQDKLWFEMFAAGLISAIAEAAITTTQDIADDQDIENNTLNDYETRTEVLSVITILENTLNDYFDTLGAFQTDNPSSLDSYTPQPETIISVKSLVQSVQAQLKQIAIGAKQERVYVLPEELNIIVLSHRLYGNTENETIQRLINDNDLSSDELILLKKDREIIYYI